VFYIIAAAEKDHKTSQPNQALKYLPEEQTV